MTTLNLGMFCFSKGVRKISQTIFFSRTPLLRTVAITDPKSAPPPPLPHEGVRNNGSRLYSGKRNTVNQ